MIKDSGNRTHFLTGAVRDIQIGKGDCSLLPFSEVASLLEYSLPIGYGYEESPIRWIYHYIQSCEESMIGVGNSLYINGALFQFAHERGWDIPTMIIEVSKHFEEGASKYKRNNWRLGITASRYIDSGIRHYLKWKRGDDDERHDRAFVWNMLCLLWTVLNRPECNDLREIEECKDDEVVEPFKEEDDGT